MGAIALHPRIYGEDVWHFSINSRHWQGMIGMRYS